MATASEVKIIISAKDDASKVFAAINKQISDVTKDATDKVKSSYSEVEKGAQGMSAKTAAIMGAVAGVISNVFSRAVDMVRQSISSAIQRVDTLNNSTRTFQNMGFSADQTKKSMDALERSIKGLPTPLDAAVRNVQLIAASTNDLGKSQQIFSAMNNAILGFGGSTQMVETAVLQMSQAFAGGKIDAATWNSMLNANLGPALNAIARDMGITTKQLKEGLSEGSISVEQFQDKLIQLNTQGGGGMKSFQTIAKDATSGIGTGIENAKTAITRGVASIIQTLGASNISGLISQMGTYGEQALKGFANAIKVTTQYIQENQAWLKPLAVVIGAVAAVWITWTAAIKAWTIATNIAKTAQMAFNAVMAANPIMLIIMAVAALVAAFIYFWNTSEAFRNFFIGMWKGIQNVIGGVVQWFIDVWNGISSFFSGLWQGIVDIFNGVVNFLKEWGLTILAVMFWPFSLLLGFIIQNWAAISAFFTGVGQWFADFFTGIWNGIVAIFTPVVQFYMTIFTAAWNAIMAVWNAVVGWFKGVWNGIVSVFSAVANWFGGIFRGAWSAIKTAMSPIIGFFQGIWNGIVGIFKGIGSAVSNAVGGAVKGAVNGALSVAEGAINGFIDIINGAIGIINNIPGVKIGKVGKVSFGRLAAGTNFSDEGMHLVGENGPELVNLPRGSRVVPAQRTANAIADARGGRGDINITVNAEVKNEIDLQQLASQMGYMVSQA